MSNQDNNNQRNNNYNNAKPWYKVWWIWVIIVIAFIILLTVIGSKDDSSNDSSNNSNTTKTASSYSKSKIKSENDDDNSNNEIKTTGNTLDFKGLKTKVNKVTYWSGDGEVNTPDQGKQYIIANVTITNNRNTKASYNPFDYSFSDNGNETDSEASLAGSKYEGTELNDGTLQSGATTTANLIGQAQPNHKIQLVYNDDVDEQSGSIDLN